MKETAIVIGNGTVKRFVSVEDVINTVESVWKAYGEGKIIMPPKITTDMSSAGVDGWFNSMPCYIKDTDTAGIKVAEMEHIVDTQFAAMLEDLSENVKYLRVDADIADALKGDGDVTENKTLSDLFKKVSGCENLTVSFEPLKDESIPALLNVSEESRRMEEAMRLYAMQRGEADTEFSFPVDMSLIVNTASSLTKKLEALADTDIEKAEKIASYIYKLSLISQRKLTEQEMKDFLSEGYSILELI